MAGKKASDTSFDYCLKNETRIEGPWTDKKTFINLPLDVKMVKELRPWQETLRIMALRFELRKLDIIYCPLGNSGKSTFVRWMHCHKHGMRLPPFETYKDLGRAVSAHDFKSLYMFDLPRAMDKRKHQRFSKVLKISRRAIATTIGTQVLVKKRFASHPQGYLFLQTNYLTSNTYHSIGGTFG